MPIKDSDQGPPDIVWGTTAIAAVIGRRRRHPTVEKHDGIGESGDVARGLGLGWLVVIICGNQEMKQREAA
jgi:hypothetical protein